MLEVRYKGKRYKRLFEVVKEGMRRDRLFKSRPEQLEVINEGFINRRDSYKQKGAIQLGWGDIYRRGQLELGEFVKGRKEGQWKKTSI